MYEEKKLFLEMEKSSYKIIFKLCQAFILFYLV